MILQTLGMYYYYFDLLNQGINPFPKELMEMFRKDELEED